MDGLAGKCIGRTSGQGQGCGKGRNGENVLHGFDLRTPRGRARLIHQAADRRPHSFADARDAPSLSDLSFSHTAGSITHSRLVKVPKPQSVDAMHPLAVADRRDGVLDPPRHDFRMLDKVGGRLDHAGDQDHVLGQGHFFERRILVGVTRVDSIVRAPTLA